MMPLLSALAGLSPSCCAVRVQIEHGARAGNAAVARNTEMIRMINGLFMEHPLRTKDTILSTNLFSLHIPLETLPLFLVENSFAKPDLFRSHLDTLVLLNILHTFFQRHLLFGNDTYRIVASAGTHIRELFSFRCIHDQIAWFDVFRYDLTRIYILTRIHEESSALL